MTVLAYIHPIPGAREPLQSGNTASDDEDRTFNDPDQTSDQAGQQLNKAPEQLILSRGIAWA
jgi:hypothetical protein